MGGLDVRQNYRMTLTDIFQQQIQSLVRDSRRFRFVPFCAVAAPLIIFIGYIAFPSLETRGVGYPLFRFACATSFTLAGAGVIGWILERRYQGGTSAWILLLLLLIETFGSLGLRLFGDFYWAFSRGYFLD